MNGEQLKRIVEKHTYPTFVGSGFARIPMPTYDWDAIAVEISKPLTMEELVEMINQSCHLEVGDLVNPGLGYYLCLKSRQPLDCNKLLDLINKQKEQS